MRKTLILFVAIALVGTGCLKLRMAAYDPVVGNYHETVWTDVESIDTWPGDLFTIHRHVITDISPQFDGFDWADVCIQAAYWDPANHPNNGGPIYETPVACDRGTVAVTTLGPGSGFDSAIIYASVTMQTTVNSAGATNTYTCDVFEASNNPSTVCSENP